MEIPEEACAPETDIDTDSDSEATAITIQKPKQVQEWFILSPSLRISWSEQIVEMKTHLKFSETTSVRTMTPMSFASTAIEALSDTDSDSYQCTSRNEIEVFYFKSTFSV